MNVLTAIVWVLAGVTVWSVAALALALIVGPIIRNGQHAERSRWRRTGGARHEVARQRAIGAHPGRSASVVPLHPRR